MDIVTEETYFTIVGWYQCGEDRISFTKKAKLERSLGKNFIIDDEKVAIVSSWWRGHLGCGNFMKVEMISSTYDHTDYEKEIITKNDGDSQMRITFSKGGKGRFTNWTAGQNIASIEN